jgi:hypothetical protein
MPNKPGFKSIPYSNLETVLSQSSFSKIFVQNLQKHSFQILNKYILGDKGSNLNLLNKVPIS